MLFKIERRETALRFRESDMINEQRLLAEFLKLVSFDSESLHEGPIRDHLKQRLTELGLEVREDDAAARLGSEAGNLYARLDGTGESVLFSAHMDTVSPGRGKRAVVEDGTVRSDGTTVLGADDCAGLAAILEALTVLRERDLPHPPIELLFTVAEELYGQGSVLFDYARLTSGAAYVLDLSGPVGRAAVRAPTILRLDIAVRGRAAHAGFCPERGVNALRIAASALAEIPTGRVAEDTTVNFGVISGGTGVNVVPEEVRISGEIRSLRHERAVEKSEGVAGVFREKARALGGDAEITVTEQVRAYRIGSRDPVVRRFERAAEAMGLEPRQVTTFGGSDNNHFVRHGIRGIVLACGMNEVHSVRETQDIAELVRLAELTLRLMEKEKA